MQEIHADIKFLSRKFKVSERYARDIFLDARTKKGSYDFLECIDLYIAYRDEQLKDIESKRDKLVEIKSETAQFKLDVLKKDYIPVDEVEIILGELTNKVKSKVRAIPSKGGRLLEGENDRLQIEAILKEFTDEVLRGLSEYEDMDWSDEDDLK
jgi:DNA polymerase III delta prime subunit